MRAKLTACRDRHRACARQAGTLSRQGSYCIDRGALSSREEDTYAARLANLSDVEVVALA